MRQRTSNRHTQKQHKTAHIKITNASALLDCFVVILCNYACTHTVPNTSDTAACRLTAPLTLTLIRYDNENAFNQPNDWPAWRRMSRYRQTQQRGKKKVHLISVGPGCLTRPVDTRVNAVDIILNAAQRGGRGRGLHGITSTRTLKSNRFSGGEKAGDRMIIADDGANPICTAATTPGRR